MKPCPTVAIASLVLMTFVAAAILRAEDWTQFRGPNGSGVSVSKTAPPTEWGPDRNIAWTVDLPGAGASSPVLIGDAIFLTCYSGFGIPGDGGGDLAGLKRHVARLDRKTGAQRWAIEVPVKQPEQDRIREDHGYASSTPAVDAERVYVFFGKSGVFAFDHSGKQLWHADVGSRLNGWGSAASPVLHGDLLIVNASVESESLVALNKKTGKRVWTAEGINEAWNAPLLVTVPGAGKSELVIATMGKILGLDPATGARLWSCDTDIGWYMVPNLVADKEGIVYAIGGRSGVAALAVRAGGKGDVTKQRRLWTGMKGSNVSSPILHDGRLYWANDNTGIAFCAEAKTGKIVYEERMGRREAQVYASPVMAGGNVYYTTRDGTTFVVAAKPTFELLATNPPVEERGTFNATPAVADGRLYVRSNKALYCIAAP